MDGPGHCYVECLMIAEKQILYELAFVQSQNTGIQKQAVDNRPGGSGSKIGWMLIKGDKTSVMSSSSRDVWDIMYVKYLNHANSVMYTYFKPYHIQ